MTASDTLGTTSVDPTETEKFARLAAEWWDPKGSFRPLHKFNPVRLRFLRDEIARHFGRDQTSSGVGRPFEGLRVVDIGCGGGLLCEPLCRLGADVVGVDAAAQNIDIARAHAAGQGLAIDYRATTAEAVLEGGERFDVVLAMEIIEHVADGPAFLRSCAGLLAPGGLMVVATLNRTRKAFALAIVGAEHILRWLPKGTHQWEKFVTPGEVRDALIWEGLTVEAPVGVVYSPLQDAFKLSRDTDVNYMMVVRRPADAPSND
ncbi:MAG: bifunctional 2-polyprenyl-6-hydroxyphenol methylase/3-demethylubiquinol 3-O-methyltransferase UbiG [Pseudomonadota bacterium]